MGNKARLTLMMSSSGRTRRTPSVVSSNNIFKFNNCFLPDSFNKFNFALRHARRAEDDQHGSGNAHQQGGDDNDNDHQQGGDDHPGSDSGRPVCIVPFSDASESDTSSSTSEEEEEEACLAMAPYDDDHGGGPGRNRHGRNSRKSTSREGQLVATVTERVTVTVSTSTVITTSSTSTTSSSTARRSVRRATKQAVPTTQRKR